MISVDIFNVETPALDGGFPMPRVMLRRGSSGPLVPWIYQRHLEM